MESSLNLLKTELNCPQKKQVANKASGQSMQEEIVNSRNSDSALLIVIKRDLVLSDL
jgi:hypothetical protein